MAVYKIFPQKSTTLYSYYPTLNAGLDEILELSTYESIDSTNEVSRPLIQFPQDEINDIITNKVNGANYKAYLKLYLANASQIPLDYTLYCYPLSGSWNMGTGRFSNSPITTDGASWQYKDQLSGSAWFTAGSFPAYTTGSYYGTNVGGGLWFYGYWANTQVISYSDSKDIELDVTNIVTAWNSTQLPNNGFILKHSDSIEFTTASKFELKYFSDNTHTIYPPCLEIRWNDFSYNTGSQLVINSDLYVTSIGNNKNYYQQDSVQRFNIKIRPKYPPRTFSASSFSFNMSNYVFPTSSYWSLKDLDSEEIVVDYDTTYTKISCNTSGSYFDLYMNGLEPERWYQLLFKTILSNGETVVFDENYSFKVIR
jgi:hypothetical protein